MALLDKLKAIGPMGDILFQFNRGLQQLPTRLMAFKRQALAG